MKKIFALSYFCMLTASCADMYKSILACHEAPLSIEKHEIQIIKEKIIFQFNNSQEFFIESPLPKELIENPECIISQAFHNAQNHAEIILTLPFDITTTQFLPLVLKALPKRKELTKITAILNDETYTYTKKINIIYELEHFFRFIKGFDYIVWFLCTHALVQPHLLIATDLYPGQEKDFNDLIIRAQGEIARQKPLNNTIEELFLRKKLIQKFNDCLAISRQYGLQQFEKKLYSQLLKTRNPLILNAIFHLQLPCQDINVRLSFLEYAFNKLIKLYNFNEIIQFYLACNPPLDAENIRLDTKVNSWSLSECMTIYNLYQWDTKHNRDFKSLFSSPVDVDAIHFTALKPQDRLINPIQIIEKLINH